MDWIRIRDSASTPSEITITAKKPFITRRYSLRRTRKSTAAIRIIKRMYPIVKIREPSKEITPPEMYMLRPVKIATVSATEKVISSTAAIVT